jgi:phage portal protein BeeE
MSAALERSLTRGRRLRGDLVARASSGTGYNDQGATGMASLVSLSHGQNTILGDRAGQGQMVNHNEQMRHNTGIVFSCVRAIAQRAAGQPFRVARLLDRSPAKALRPKRDCVPKHLKQVQDRMQLVDDHPILDSLERPNAAMTRWALTFVTLSALEICGKSYWWSYQGDEDAAPGGWTHMPLPPSWVRPLHENGGIFTGYMVRPGNASQEIPVPADEMTYFHYPDLSNPLGALSPLQAIARAVVANESISESQRRAFSNGIWAGYAVTVGKNVDGTGQPNGSRPRLTKSQRGQIMAQFLQAYRGVMNYDNPVILDGIIESVSKISNTPREMDFLKSYGLTKEEISQGFGVNPIIMGQVQGVNKASAAAADDHFCSSCINPKLELLSQIMTTFLAPRFAAPGERLILYYEPAHSNDPELEIEKQKTLMGFAGMTVNELREQLGMQDMPGGNIALLPSTLAPYNLEEAYDFEAEAEAADAATAATQALAAAHAANQPAGGQQGGDPAANPDAGKEGGTKTAGRFPQVGNARKSIW